MNKTPYSSINAENIEVLVRTFYKQVLDNTILAPFFIEKLGDNFKGPLWEEHLLLLTEFWKFVALGYEDYAGNPLEPHQQMEDISKEAFENWLTLFHKTVDELYSAQAGDYFKQKSHDIAQNFIRRLGI